MHFPASDGRYSKWPHAREVLIRTIGIGLVAVVALLASFTIARHRAEQRPDASASPEPPAAEADPLLDAIRTAGL